MCRMCICVNHLLKINLEVLGIDFNIFCCFRRRSIPFFALRKRTETLVVHFLADKRGFVVFIEH